MFTFLVNNERKNFIFIRNRHNEPLSNMKTIKRLPTHPGSVLKEAAIGINAESLSEEPILAGRLREIRKLCIS